MFKDILSSLRAILVLTVITSVAYPLAITAIAQLAFSKKANGSLVKSGDQIIGSELLAQKFSSPKYFWPRPSAVASGASNQGFTSKKLADAIHERRALLGPSAPADLLTASGSGLDPDISPEAARFQAPRIASARNLPAETVAGLVESSIEKPQLGFLGQSRVNVLLLNRKLDQL